MVRINGGLMSSSEETSRSSSRLGPNVRERARQRAEAIQTALRAQIVESNLPFGARLPEERELARQFDTSRATVRAALTALEREGLIERRQGSGTYVAFAPEADLNSFELRVPSVSPIDVMEARRVLEPGLAELVVRRITAEDLDRMAACLKAMENARDQTAFKMAGYSFHLEIARASRNPLIVVMYELLIAARAKARWATLLPLNDTTELKTEQIDNLWAIHRALRDGDIEEASRRSYQSLSAMIQAIVEVPV